MNSYLEPDYQPVFDAWKKAPGPETIQPLLDSVKPVIDSAVKSYVGSSPNQTLNSRAKLLTIQALNSYDPSRAKLRTHLLSHLRGLQRHAAKSRQIIRIPERVAIDLGKVRDAEKELKDVLGRDPNTSELSDHMGISPKRISKLYKVQPGLTEGQTTLITDQGEDALLPGVVNNRGQELWLDYIYHDLHPSDKLIFEHSLGLYGKRKLSKGDIARKVGLSAGAVSQRLAKIQEKIDLIDKTHGLF